MILVELYDAKPRVIEKRLEKDGDILRCQVLWQRAGVANQNNRLYRKELLQREIARLQPMVEKGAIYGSSYHPTDAGVDDVTHIFESIQMQRDGACTGTVKILPTSRGKNLQTIIRAGGYVGMSSRGVGTTTKREIEIAGKKTEVEEVNDDYILRSPGDFVLSPSVSDTGVQKILESKFEKTEKKISEMDLIRRFHGAQRAGYRGDYLAYRKLFLEKDNV